MTIKTFSRYEKKFVINEDQYKAILPGIMQYMHPDGNCKEGQEYVISNIYYDTDNSSLIRHSLSKPFYKEKLRIRSYDIPVSPNSEVFLELKKKIGGVVIKRRAVLSLIEASLFLDYGINPQPADYINGQVLNEIAYFLNTNPVKPTAYISYRRKALFGKDDKNFRITFDRNIITRREELDLEKGRFGTDLLADRYLMEVKIAGAFPLWLTGLLADHKVYSTRYSKYGQEYMKNVLEQTNLQSAPGSLIHFIPERRSTNVGEPVFIRG
ncbi:MAG: polyphosphate polymerase domain-containing protein [Syntrophomonadaceae bacterium]|nr:polyphosphate polymerase domain-containing protein [Syntrophomonadaceae bacterium]